MLELSKCCKLIDDGFSLITVGENKRPNYSWKQSQTKPLSKEAFTKQYNYKGGVIKKDGEEMQPTTNIGLATGYDGLECIDVDLKVFGNAQDKKEFWNEYLNFLKDNIFDFEKKFVVAKTQNEGYHIIYKNTSPKGNCKIAKLKDHKEAVIESRGVGGYIFLYENFLFDLTYSDVQLVSDEDIAILWEISQTYNYITEQVEIQTVEHTYTEQEITTWQDYNNKVSIFDIIGSEFTIVRDLNNKRMIKRHGATSAHSGYVFKDSGCMYLFSTGTTYPHEKLVSPFAAYTFKYQNGDFGAAAKQLYKDGYGSRVKRNPIINQDLKIDESELQFPIDIYPTELRNYIIKCNQTLNNSIDYMGSAMLWMTSLMIGNTVKIKVKNGWVEPCNVWIAIIGMKGIGKTPSIKSIVYPLERSNMRQIKNYAKEMKKYEEYKELTKDEKKHHEEIKQPKKSQFIAKDVTLEALVDMHEDSPNGVGVLKDELAGWFKDMNKYRSGSDLEHWLSSWNGESIILSRKTSKSAYVENGFIPVLGGIQPSIFELFYNGDNSENGFIDRMLFSFPELDIEHYNDNELDEEILEWYENAILTVKGQIDKIRTYDDYGEIKPIIAQFTDEAKKEWVNYFNELTNYQNSDEENEYIKAMIPKQKSYTPRFALIINVLSAIAGETPYFDFITIDSVKKAIKLSKYFIEMAKKVKFNSIEQKAISKVSKDDNISTEDKVKQMYNDNPNFNRKQAAILLNVSRVTINKYLPK
jgi:hypothetical protein